MASTMAATTTALKPAMTPPPGFQSDFETDDNLYKWNIVTQCVCLVIPSIGIATRSAVRLGILKKWSLEDWLCIASWVFFLCYASIVSYTMDHGGGIHEWNLTKTGAQTVLYWNNVAQIVYSMSILTTKISLLYLYLGIFAPTRYSKNWWAVVVVMVANTGFYVGLMFAKIFQCWPRDAIWDKSITDANCVSLVGILDASGAWNTLSDFTILALPLLFIWKLKLSREKRIGIIAIFAVGIIAPVFSLVGVIIRVETSASSDLTYYQPRLLFFAEAEITSGILCTCLPCLPRLWKWIKGEKENTISHSGDRSYQFNKIQRRRTTMLANNSDKHFLTSDYMELDDIVNGSLSSPPRAMVTNVTGGRGDVGIAVGDADEERVRGMMANGGIWKTTEVTVQHEVIDGATSESSSAIQPVERTHAV